MKVSTILASLFLGASVTLAAPAQRNSHHEYDMCVSGCSDKKGGETSFEKCVEDTCSGRNRSNGHWNDGEHEHNGEHNNDGEDEEECEEEHEEEENDNERVEDSYSAKKKSKGGQKQ